MLLQANSEEQDVLLQNLIYFFTVPSHKSTVWKMSVVITP